MSSRRILRFWRLKEAPDALERSLKLFLAVYHTIDGKQSLSIGKLSVRYTCIEYLCYLPNLNIRNLCACCELSECNDDITC